MKELNNTETNLIIKHLNNSATEDEKANFSKWLEISIENQKAFENVSEIWENVHDPSNNYDPDAEHAWKLFNDKLSNIEKFEGKKQVKIIPLYLIAKMAAGFLLLIGIAWFLKTRYYDQPKITYLTAANEDRIYSLPDNSKVVLKKHSSISFADNFKVDNRKVNLIGEAFFQVFKDSSKPFIITGPHATITVMGTTFTSRMPNNFTNTEVEVITGRVLFQNRKTPDENLIITPGYKATFSKDGKIIKYKSEHPILPILIDKQICFKNEKLSEVVNKIQKYFEVTVHVENFKMNECLYTGTFDNPNINDVMETIGFTFNFKLEEKDGIFLLKGGNCNE